MNPQTATTRVLRKFSIVKTVPSLSYLPIDKKTGKANTPYPWFYVRVRKDSDHINCSRDGLLKKGRLLPS